MHVCHDCSQPGKPELKNPRKNLRDTNTKKVPSESYIAKYLVSHVLPEERQVTTHDPWKFFLSPVVTRSSSAERSGCSSWAVWAKRVSSSAGPFKMWRLVQRTEWQGAHSFGSFSLGEQRKWTRIFLWIVSTSLAHNPRWRFLIKN